MKKRIPVLALLAVCLSGCFIIENSLFPIWEPNYFDEPPAPEGPYTVNERRVEIEDGADGSPFGVTVFEPMEAEDPLPTFMWVMGSNVQAYYHQSLHEILASWGYLILVPDTRRLSFTDFQYHNRIVSLAEQTLELAAAGGMGRAIDPDRIAAGGYSVGGPLAAFTAARAPEIAALVYWAPAGAPFWQGLNGNELYGQVTQPALYVLGELDQNAPPDGGLPDEMQERMSNSMFTEEIIEGATHHQFQQPTGADPASAEPGITRFEQQGRAINITRIWLDATLL